MVYIVDDGEAKFLRNTKIMTITIMTSAVFLMNIVSVILFRVGL